MGPDIGESMNCPPPSQAVLQYLANVPFLWPGISVSKSVPWEYAKETCTRVLRVAAFVLVER